MADRKPASRNKPPVRKQPALPEQSAPPEPARKQAVPTESAQEQAAPTEPARKQAVPTESAPKQAVSMESARKQAPGKQSAPIPPARRESVRKQVGRKGVAGRRVARILDVAALAGVSVGTASKALNDTGQLSPGTRERVRRAADQLGFVPDTRGRALQSGRTFTVALLTTDSSGRFSNPIMRGVEDVLSAGELATILCDTRDDPLREQHYLRSLVARRVDGIVVTGRRTEPRPPIDVPLPTVYALAASTARSDTSVIVDEQQGAASVVKHLVGLGRTRIAHVTGPAQHRSAAERAGAVVDHSGSIFAGEVLFGEWSEQWGRQATDLLLRKHPELDAITCGSDQIARGVTDRLRELGRAVPGDIAVTGYDNWEVMALASRPPLTSVDLQLEELGRRSAQLLLESIGGTRHHGTLELPTRLIPRESTLGS